MKKILIIFLLSLSYNSINAQQNLDVIFLHKDVTTHFMSTSNISYVDISTKRIVGNKAMSNVYRIRPKKIQTGGEDLGVITIIGEKYFCQYKLLLTEDPDKAMKRVDIDESLTYKNPNYSITSDKLEEYSKKMIKEKKTVQSVKSKKYKMKISLNNIWVVDDLFFIDFSADNNTNIKYTIDQIRYKIIDRKTNKSVTNQDLEINPIFIYDNAKSFKKKYRNVVVFKKFTYPDDKQFQIELAETSISGRTAYLHIPYSDFLNAKTF